MNFSNKKIGKWVKDLKDFDSKSVIFTSETLKEIFTSSKHLRKNKAYLQSWTSRKTRHSRNSNCTLEFNRKSKEGNSYNSKYKHIQQLQLQVFTSMSFYNGVGWGV